MPGEGCLPHKKASPPLLGSRGGGGAGSGGRRGGQAPIVKGLAAGLRHLGNMGHIGCLLGGRSPHLPGMVVVVAWDHQHVGANTWRLGVGFGRLAARLCFAVIFPIE